MPNNLARKAFLEDELIDLEIPFVSVTVTDINASPVVASIQYAANATPEQITLGNERLAAFDWRLRQPLKLGTVVDTVRAMLDTNAKKLAFLDVLFADYLRTNPRVAARVARKYGTQALVVDEVVP